MLIPRRSLRFPYTTLFRSAKLPHGNAELADWMADAPNAGFSNLAAALSAAWTRASIRKQRTSKAASGGGGRINGQRSEEHTSELQSRRDLVCRLLLEKKYH